MHPFSTPWKHKKTVSFSDVFKGQRKGALGTNEWINLTISSCEFLGPCQTSMMDHFWENSEWINTPLAIFTKKAAL